MNQRLMEKFNRFRGKELQYIDENGKIQQRVLSRVFYHPDAQEHFAVFMYRSSEPLKRFFQVCKRVPIHRVLEPDTRQATSSKNSTRVVNPNLKPENFELYGHYYNVAKISNYNAGDQIVWMAYSNQETACVGTLMFTARTFGLGARDLNEVAVVSMEDMVMADNRTPAPGYMRTLKTKEYLFPFVIPMTQVLKFDEWIFTMTPKEDEWTLVERRGKGKNLKQLLHSDSDLSTSRNPPANNVALKNDTVSGIRENSFARDVGRPKTTYGLPNETSFPLVHSSSTTSKTASSNILEWDNQVNMNGKNAGRSDIIPKTTHDLSETNASVLQEETNWQKKLDKWHFLKLAEQTNGVGVGIQGNANSCYMDASLFALFSFHDIIDNLLDGSLEEFVNTKEETVSGKVKTAVRNIVGSIRQNFYVPYSYVRRLRKIMRKEIRTEYSKQCMDVEDFLTDFFKLVDASPFLIYDNGEGDYMHQIALPFTWDESQYQRFLTLQDLIDNSFKTFGVSLEKVPENVFIVKLPISDGVLIPSDGVIPNLTLDMGKILRNPREGGDHKMTLQAVICLKDHHFVTFVRMDKISSNIPWVYMDSRPTIEEPFTSILQSVDQNIITATEELQKGRVQNMSSLEPTCQGISMFRHAYICIYVKQ